MSYHTLTREALAELEGETGAYEADDERGDGEPVRREDGTTVRDEPAERRSPDGPEDADRRPEPVGFA